MNKNKIKKYPIVKKSKRTLETFSEIMLMGALNQKTQVSFCSFLVSSKKEIDNFLKNGVIPERVFKRPV